MLKIKTTNQIVARYESQEVLSTPILSNGILVQLLDMTNWQHFNEFPGIQLEIILSFKKSGQSIGSLSLANGQLRKVNILKYDYEIFEPNSSSKEKVPKKLTRLNLANKLLLRLKLLLVRLKMFFYEITRNLKYIFVEVTQDTRR